MHRIRWIASLALGLAVLSTIRPAFGQFSGAFEGMSFQGYLTDDSDNPINTEQNIAVRLFNASTSGTQYWYRLYSGVPVVNGIFDLVLSEGTPTLNSVPFDTQYYVDIEVDGEHVTPRTKLVSVPYALDLRNLRVIPQDGSEGPSLLGGFLDNAISGGVNGATISGGGADRESNSGRQQVTGSYGTVGGGISNTAGGFATVGGGDSNTAIGEGSAIGGGSDNTASGDWSAVAGGRFLSASGENAAVGGGISNTAAGVNSVVPGGFTNYAGGRSSFAGGELAHVRDAGEAGQASGDQGTFIWSDRSTPSVAFESTGSNQFLIKAAGGVGIDTNAPVGQLHIAHANSGPDGFVIEANEADRLYTYFISDEYASIGTYRPSDSRRLPISFQPQGGNVGIGVAAPSERLEVNGNVLANNVAVPSDARYKRDVAPLTGSLASLSKLKGVSYTYDTDAFPEKDFDHGTHMGLIAQEVQKVFPEIVHEAPSGYLSVNYIELIPVLLEAIKELQDRVDVLEAAQGTK